MTNTVKAQICSQNLTIVTDESVDYINDLAEELNSKINESVKENSFKPLITNIIFCALQYCDENKKLRKENENLKEQIDVLARENDSLKRGIESSLKQPSQKPSRQQSLFDRDIQNNPRHNRGNHNRQH